MENIHLQVHSVASKEDSQQKYTQFVEFKKSNFYINKMYGICITQATVSIHIHGHLQHRHVSKIPKNEQLRIRTSAKLTTR